MQLSGLRLAAAPLPGQAAQFNPLAAPVEDLLTLHWTRVWAYAKGTGIQMPMSGNITYLDMRA
jgi:hypothetical protein